MPCSEPTHEEQLYKQLNIQVKNKDYTIRLLCHACEELKRHHMLDKMSELSLWYETHSKHDEQSAEMSKKMWNKCEDRIPLLQATRNRLISQLNELEVRALHTLHVESKDYPFAT